MHSFFLLSSMWIRTDYENVLVKKYPLYGLLLFGSTDSLFYKTPWTLKGKPGIQFALVAPGAYTHIFAWSGICTLCCSLAHTMHKYRASCQGTLHPPCSWVLWGLSLDFHQHGKHLKKSVLCASMRCKAVGQLWTQGKFLPERNPSCAFFVTPKNVVLGADSSYKL